MYIIYGERISHYMIELYIIYIGVLISIIIMYIITFYTAYAWYIYIGHEEFFAGSTLIESVGVIP